jgi:predicted DNA-binding transcriptional regulator AlpA
MNRRTITATARWRKASATPPHNRPRKPPPVIPRPPNGLLRVREAAARLGLSKSTLDKMRCDGRGPRFVKITGKIVGYDPDDLDAYAEARKRQSASDV